jgi:hypothetical protein
VVGGKTEAAAGLSGKKPRRIRQILGPLDQTLLRRSPLGVHDVTAPRGHPHLHDLTKRRYAAVGRWQTKAPRRVPGRRGARTGGATESGQAWKSRRTVRGMGTPSEFRRDVPRAGVVAGRFGRRDSTCFGVWSHSADLVPLAAPRVSTLDQKPSRPSRTGKSVGRNCRPLPALRHRLPLGYGVGQRRAATDRAASASAKTTAGTRRPP